ncbi:hypothetical protein [Bdellovibrio reynosensis]|uniref:Uncharacterized protein n=1 Tax=Bdellovibrio reynosensis TaxID=2835041 RepID=A0ABY4C8L9_9BACT|nr:hypothetical protein [Bdellovibrio reynosensis]UOF01326.1 hypothetical protein MNR06_16655 [Bdellovibrio reynosensis]
MKTTISVILFLLFWALNTQAAVVHFYSHPQVPQKWFHVALEYKGYLYEADTRVGGRRLPISQVKKKSDETIVISDSLVSEEGLLTQMGLPFDYEFIWNNQKTYCSKLVGIALNMEPTPMTFAGTHYVKYYPHWIHRNDPGLSPDQVYDFAKNVELDSNEYWY